MTRIIQQITQQLIDRLPDNDQYYRLDELRSWGFPSFIIKRIKIELERNLAESMIPPKTDWANIQSDAVQFAWQKFVDAIRAEARLPASYAKTVIETAVADVIEMLIQPRKNIPEVIFGTDDELSYEEIADRAKAVVVYRHFSTLVPRFMQKKELNKLSKERCAKIIAKADEKLTARYSPLNWAQMLEPLFNLQNGNIDTNLFRLFFEDKNMLRIAREFDLMNDTLSRAQFIEVLSSPDLLDFEGYEDDQSTLFGDQPETKAPKTEQEIPKPTEEPEEVATDRSTKDDKQKEEKADDPKALNKDAMSSLFPDNDSEPEEESEKTLNTDFTGADGDEDGAEVETEDQKEKDNTINASFVGEDEEEIEAAESEQELAEEVVEVEEEKTEEADSTVNEDEEKAVEKPELADEEAETPMWMRYMSEEEIEEYKKQELEEPEIEDEDTDDDGFIDDPIIDLTNEEASDEEIEELSNMLSDDRDLFVEEIFRGSDRAYDQAIEDIAAYDDWQSASKYIQKDIFKRNLVDMYSEEAVDFTDRLQSYFLRKQKSK